jgi:hypothetical protein
MKLDMLNQIDWQQEYENLRREALQVGLRGHGLALFLSRGMVAWLEALTALRAKPMPKNSQYESIDLLSAVRSDLTILLADMVLSCLGREGL